MRGKFHRKIRMSYQLLEDTTFNDDVVWGFFAGFEGERIDYYIDPFIRSIDVITTLRKEIYAIENYNSSIRKWESLNNSKKIEKNITGRKKHSIRVFFILRKYYDYEFAEKSLTEFRLWDMPTTEVSWRLQKYIKN